MNWVDVIILLVALLAAISGARQGVIVALPAFLGVLSGAIIGIRFAAPMVVDMFKNPAAKVALAFATVVFLVAIGETFGVWVGRTLKERLGPDHASPLENALGAVVQGVAAFAIAWLVGFSMTSVSGLPGLATAINNSKVLATVNDNMPPQAHALPNDLRKLLDVSGLPRILPPFVDEPNRQVKPPDTALQKSEVVREVRPSVLKIRGEAPSCSRRLEGSGFVIAPQRVITNAHVVAGTNRVQVESGGSLLDATVVHFDPDTDVAILNVPALDAPVLDFQSEPADGGDSSIVLGYPLDGPYTATPARVRQRITLRGPDIYERKTVRRDVYTVRGQIRSGNSGGPMIAPDGDVLGVVFGASVQEPDTGFTLTAQEVAPEVQSASSMTSPVGTGSCTS
ncbi:MAG: MarP family serine protease [Actinophytocola sp.]|nr:MarP family serine protease [Actinophytocola sp.]